MPYFFCAAEHNSIYIKGNLETTPSTLLFGIQLISQMEKFIELKVSDDNAEIKLQLVNISTIGRVYGDPQNNRRCIVELNYQSINDAPVYLEVEMPYETVRAYLLP